MNNLLEIRVEVEGGGGGGRDLKNSQRLLFLKKS